MIGGQPIVRSTPQVKICGLTQPDEAAGCAVLGADAIGLVFFPKSPRNVTPDQAKAVAAALPNTVATVGVFVNETFSFIMARVDRCRLSMVQLHGQESPDLAHRLKAEGLGVIKALFVNGTPGLKDVSDFSVDGYLVECVTGPLPGGNAMAWDWGVAREFGQCYPLVLAGGLAPDIVAASIAASQPAAIDISSGVEALPGHKDLGKVARLLSVVQGTIEGYSGKSIRPVFRKKGDRYSA